MFRRCLYLVLFLSVWTPTVALAAPPDAAVDAIFADALKTYPIPGLAVGIVRNEEVVYLKGYGVREAGGTAAVTPDTLFAIGSCTKAFTATALAQLVDEAKFLGMIPFASMCRIFVCPIRWPNAR
jgi:CubicO group peptidase (beta-lactamase class C family)